MKAYTLTVYESSGEKLLDETFEAENEKEAKKIGVLRLQDMNYQYKTYRCVSSLGKLVLFNR
ncbi:YhzD family protein [Priestia endophytica]|uniref:YhzD-like protein n=1 Tax=Priestia endophytica TaxID=135735 RepID=A0AAX1Q2E7_9BACI|nr:YhzD family protein [Priestia endophytica]RAS72460.1 hypothetical protein A3864_25715 [Priestia endophytica]RAS90098.1 hypothetical protein A3863_12950 [Priestia endophytica]